MPDISALLPPTIPNIFTDDTSLNSRDIPTEQLVDGDIITTPSPIVSPEKVALRAAQGFANGLLQATIDIKKLLNKLRMGGSILPQELADAQAMQTLNMTNLRNSLEVDLPAYGNLITQADLTPLQNAMLIGSKTLTSEEIISASKDAYNQIFEPAYGDILLKLAIGQDTTPTQVGWGSLITIDNNGNTVINNPQAVYNAITAAQINPKNILFPIQPAGSNSDEIGRNWADVQAFAISVGYLNKNDATNLPPITALAYIREAYPFTNPKTYVVFPDVSITARMLKALEPYKNSVNPLSSSISSQVLQDAQTLFNTGQRLQYPYVSDGDAWLQPGATDAKLSNSLFGQMEVYLDKIQSQYLEPVQQAAGKYNAFFAAFTSAVYSKIASIASAAHTGTGGVEDKNASSYIWFDSPTLNGYVDNFYNSYFGSPIDHKAILYPEQTSLPPTNNGVSQAAATNWATSFGLTSDQVSSCVVETGTGTGLYMVIIDKGPITTMRDNLLGVIPGSPSVATAGNQLLTKYNSWNTGFETQVDKLKNQLQIFAQQSQNALSTYQNNTNLFSSLITSLIDSLKNYISNLR